jgi:hypothetical protein
LPYLSSEAECAKLLGGTDVSVIFTADPGEQHGGIGENYYLAQKLQNAQNVTFPACFSAQHGTLASSKVALITTGEGPSTAQLCAFQVLSCSKYIKETMFFGTAGFSPRKGGVINTPSCSPPEDEGILVRPGDVCITSHAINWDCQGAEWSQTASNWPNECTLAGSPDSPFQDAYSDSSSASYRGWDCIFLRDNQESRDLADELYLSKNATNEVSPPPSSVQDYITWYFGNTTKYINTTWAVDVEAAPHTFNRSECAEVDSVFWWTGTPWDIQARGFVSNAVGGTPNRTETVAASAMEGIGYMAALRIAENITGISVPHVIVRAASDYTIPAPIYKAANGTWLPGPEVVFPDPTGSKAPATVYAIQSGNAVIYQMFQSRDVSGSGSVGDLSGLNQDIPSSKGDANYVLMVMLWMAVFITMRA